MDHVNYKGVDPPKPDDPEFEVDMILKKRKRGGENQYLIHWVGFDDSHDSWEAEDDIDDAVIKVHPPPLQAHHPHPSHHLHHLCTRLHLPTLPLPPLASGVPRLC